MPQVGAELAEQLDTGFNRFLFRFGQRSPPVAKFIGEFDFPLHVCIIGSGLAFCHVPLTLRSPPRRRHPILPHADINHDSGHRMVLFVTDSVDEREVG